MIKYNPADDIKEKAKEIIAELNWYHVDLENVCFLRSFGSKSKYTIARCHALGRAMQLALGREKSFYIIEVISERFDKLSDENKIKTIIHELMHIPKSFGGGFKHHNIVTQKNVNKLYEKFKEKALNNLFY